jgi:hypothetical protein
MAFSSLSAQATQKVPVAQPTEQQDHLTVNVFRIAEHAGLLADTHGAEFTRPCVDILEQMTVNALQVAWRKITVGQRLVAALENGVGLERRERAGIAKIEQIHQN